MRTDAKEPVRTDRRVMRLGPLFTQALGDGLVGAGAAEIEIHSLCDDSRRVASGALFVAVPGTKTCGAAYAAEAGHRGASAIVAETDVAVGSGAVVIRVPNARRALARLAAVYYGLDHIQSGGGLDVVGVTGTNGKTTVAYLLRSVLQEAGRSVAMLGTIEYDLVARRLRAELTTPGPIALTQHLVEAHSAGARCAVLEVSSHSLDQRRTDGIRFSLGVFTNLTQDHLDYHRTAADYLGAKRRLFDGLGTDAVAVVNSDDPACEAVVSGCRARVVRYGLGAAAEVRGRVVGAGGRGGFVIEHEGERIEVRLQLAGSHNIANGLAAASVGLALGLGMDTIRRGLEGVSVVPGRLQRVDVGSGGFDVFVDYAHTDDALRNVLRAVRPLTRGRLWCVFGCGGDRDRTKRPLMAQAAAGGADRFIITSDNPRTEEPRAIIGDIEAGLTQADRRRSRTIPDRSEAIAQAVASLSPGDVLVIAGKGHEDYQILGDQRVDFDDRAVARAAIEQRQVAAG